MNRSGMFLSTFFPILRNSEDESDVCGKRESNLILYTVMVRKCSKEKNCCLHFCLPRSNGNHEYIKNTCSYYSLYDC